MTIVFFGSFISTSGCNIIQYVMPLIVLVQVLQVFPDRSGEVTKIGPRLINRAMVAFQIPTKY